MKKITMIALAAIFIWAPGFTQQDITLEAIWKNYEFIPRSVPGFNFLKDGKHYTRL